MLQSQIKVTKIKIKSEIQQTNLPGNTNIALNNLLEHQVNSVAPRREQVWNSKAMKIRHFQTRSETINSA